jgi:hypothetical protein
LVLVEELGDPLEQVVDGVGQFHVLSRKRCGFRQVSLFQAYPHAENMSTLFFAPALAGSWEEWELWD